MSAPTQVLLDPVRGDVIVEVGDSLIANGLFTAFNTAVMAKAVALFGAGAPQLPVFVNSGVAGNTVNDVDTNWDTRVGKWGPTILVVHIGINDAAGAPTTGVSPPTAIGAFTASYQSIITKTQTQLPNCQIILSTLLVYGENWPSGVNPRDSAIEAECAVIRSLAALNNCFCLELRNTTYLRDEPVGNPGHASASVMYDNVGGQGLHPTTITDVLVCNEMLKFTAYKTPKAGPFKV